MSKAGSTLAREAASLRRVRMGEESPGTVKKVWHSNGQGIDLTTEVNATGHATFHELAFYGTIVRWTKAQVHTGCERPRLSKSGRDTGADLVFDPQPNPERLAQALEICQHAPGDRYLEHLAKVVESARMYSIIDASDSVTNAQKIELPIRRPAPPSLLTRLRKALGL